MNDDINTSKTIKIGGYKRPYFISFAVAEEYRAACDALIRKPLETAIKQWEKDNGRPIDLDRDKLGFQVNIDGPAIILIYKALRARRKGIWPFTFPRSIRQLRREMGSYEFKAAALKLQEEITAPPVHDGEGEDNASPK